MLGSDAKRFHMFSKLKSSIVYYSLPIIYLTLNPAENYSPLSLLYMGEEINLQNFLADQYPLTHRVQTMLRCPLAMIEYFHTTVNAILTTLIKGSLFGELIHHYGTIKYQGQGTPHIHLLV